MQLNQLVIRDDTQSVKKNTPSLIKAYLSQVLAATYHFN